MACCDICGAVFTFQKNMYRHVIMTHNTDDLQLNAPTVKCEQCDFEGSHTKLLYHKRTKHRAEEITCSLCEERFNNKSNLNRHLITKHKDLAPVSCLVACFFH